MTDIKSELKALRLMPKYSDLTLKNVTDRNAQLLVLRYHLLSNIFTQLYAAGLGHGVSISDILNLKPVTIEGVGVCSLDNVVKAAYGKVERIAVDGLEFIKDVLKLHKLSKPTDLKDITDPSALEFLSRLPANGEIRTYRRCRLTGDAHVYFCSNRYMMLINQGKGRSDEDQNYFITTIDLGSMIQNYLNGTESFMVKHPVAIARLEKVEQTGKPYRLDTKLSLWDTVVEHGRYYWFVRGENIKRTDHTFEFLFGNSSHTFQPTLTDEVWRYYKRVFGLACISSVFRPTLRD